MKSIKKIKDARKTRFIDKQKTNENIFTNNRIIELNVRWNMNVYVYIRLKTTVQ